ncbi:hypothetical protein EDD11_009881 [Mortierella claussenii]|nr:hypothetical protein EDD11_009881 [Mortierella claussenii]
MPFDMSILTISHRRDVSSLKALIVGGGIAGLSLAIMMELAGIEYEILERSTGQEPEVGSALTLGPPALRLLEQMGLLHQIEQQSKVISGLTVVECERHKMGRLEGLDKERYGYPYRIMTRAAFYKILLDRVGTRHLHRNKVVVETLQNPNGVSCKCADGSTYYGDIIVGADGTQSTTRYCMYKHLAEQGKLPESDLEGSVHEHVSISGVSDPLDVNVYPTVVDEESEFSVIYTKETPHSFWYMPVPGNRVAWGLNGLLPVPKRRPSPFAKPYSFLNASASPTTASSSASISTARSIPSSVSTSRSTSTLSLSLSMSSSSLSSTQPQLPHSKIPSSSSSSQTPATQPQRPQKLPRVSSSSSLSTSATGPIRTGWSSSSSSTTPRRPPKIYDDWYEDVPDFQDQFKEIMMARCAIGGRGGVRHFLTFTPPKHISRVEPVERHYKTWYHGRMVLIGDACHQQLLISGQGAIQCLLDAVYLVNLLHDMENNSPSEIAKAFKKYQAKRSVMAKVSIDDSNTMDKILHGQGFMAGVMRKLVFNTAWSFNVKNDKFNNNRPQLSFLPFVEDRATIKANKQKVSTRLTRSLQAMAA